VASDAAYTTTLILGGGVGDAYIIVEVSASPTIGPDVEFTLESDSFILSDSSEPLQVQYTLYDSASAAIYDGSIIYRTSATLAKVVSAIGSSFTRSFRHSASFSQDFLRFNSTFRSPSLFSLGDASEGLASLGKVQFDNLMVDDVRLASSSLIISDITELLQGINTDAATATITGDFSTITAFLNDQEDCAGTNLALTEYDDERDVYVSIDNLVTYPFFCLSAESEEIPLIRATYQLDLGIGLGSSLLGEVIYDAASIDLPYLTDFEGYRQHIILVNHAGYDVAYSTYFIAEESVADSFAIGDAAEGTIAAGSTLILNTEDLVTIESTVSSQISARIFVDAKPSDISAALQIFSLEGDTPPMTNVLQVLEY
jgi:hypothetical protein